jgi:hypothetical protein
MFQTTMGTSLIHLCHNLLGGVKIKSSGDKVASELNEIFKFFNKLFLFI